uniref:Uncharacterized protein n=1 Tax=Cannabis sativa TaxID=3483 RepID=A0A803QPX5_CANSA
MLGRVPLEFLFALGTGVFIDFPTLMYTKMVDCAKAKGDKHTLSYPSVVQRLVMRGHPITLDQDVTMHVPSNEKSFQSIFNTHIPLSVIDMPLGNSGPSKVPFLSVMPSVTLSSLSSTSWQVQLYSVVQGMAHSYATNQHHYKRGFDSIPVATANVTTAQGESVSDVVDSLEDGA